MTDVEFHEVIVVGGGTAGLRVASKLFKSGINDVKIFEGRPFVGGRITTTRDSDGNPMFNDFAWRVAETSVNPKMHELCEELGVTLIPQTTPAPNPSETVKKTGCNKKNKHGIFARLFTSDCADVEEKVAVPRPTPLKRAPMSDFATASLSSTKEADLQDRESGYAGRTAQIAWPEEDHGNDAFVVEGGMDNIPKALAASLPEGCLHTNSRAAEVEKTDGGYLVTIVHRAGNDYKTVTYKCSQVVLACPPYALRALAVAKDMQPALFAVHERRLGHVYAKCTADTPNGVPVTDVSNVPERVYRKLPDSILQQIISGDYGGKVFQAAYACDRFERVWRELQYHGPSHVKKEVKAQLARISGLKVPPKGWDAAIEEVWIRIGFVHRWHIEAHATGKNKEELSMQAITPNPVRLPGLYLVGEAFSPHQGWTEGALWTAEKAAAIIIGARKGPGEYSCSYTSFGAHSSMLNLGDDGKGGFNIPTCEKIMLYKGMVINAEDWFARHPGGPGMILGHVGEDLSHLFDNFHSGWPAPLATLFGLQIGVSDAVWDPK